MPLKACPDLEAVVQFGQAEPVRYRHMLQHLRPLEPALLDALYGTERPQRVYLANDPEHITLLATVAGDMLELEGELYGVDREALIAWCRSLAPQHLRTTHEPLRDLLTEAFSVSSWRQDGQYTVTEDALRPRITRPVRRLTAEDRVLWEQFMHRHADEPIIAPGHGRPGTADRDFRLMTKGLPVQVYVTESEEAITGVLTTYPLTERCEEISAMFVDLEHRRRGNAHSLLSEVSHIMHKRGRLPGYSAKGDRPELRRMLTSVGYIFMAVAYEATL